MKTLLLAAGLVAAVLVAPATAGAARPSLRLACSLPNSHEIVTCHLAGQGFHARERLAITYQVVFTAQRKVHGKYPQKTYKRQAMTDGHGSFVRPPLGFSVVKYHESYRLTVTATGAAGDRATLTYTAIAQ